MQRVGPSAPRSVEPRAQVIVFPGVVIRACMLERDIMFLLRSLLGNGMIIMGVG